MCHLYGNTTYGTTGTYHQHALSLFHLCVNEQALISRLAHQRYTGSISQIHRLGSRYDMSRWSTDILRSTALCRQQLYNHLVADSNIIHTCAKCLYHTRCLTARNRRHGNRNWEHTRPDGCINGVIGGTGHMD